MKADALRDLSVDELGTRVQSLREQLLKLRFQQSTGQIESPQMLRGVRKDIARALTILRERELGAAAGTSPPTAPSVPDTGVEAPADAGADADAQAEDNEDV